MGWAPNPVYPSTAHCVASQDRGHADTLTDSAMIRAALSLHASSVYDPEELLR